MRDPAATTPAKDQAELRLAEVIGALSYALDLTEGQPPGHCIRGCWVGMQVGAELGLDTAELYDLYYTLLLKDAGCSSNAARLCQLYGADDRKTKHDVKFVDMQSLPALARFVWSHTGVDLGRATRFKLLFRLLTRGPKLANELVEARCERGASIAMDLGFSPGVATAIRCLDEHYNGKGRPCGLQGQAIPVASGIALLSQVVDVFHHAGSPAQATAEIKRRAGRWFDPMICEAFFAAAARPGFWEALLDESIGERVADLEPGARTIPLDEARLDAIAAGFGRVIDAKSPFTAGHSGRVAEYCRLMAEGLDLDENAQRTIHRAGLLHDIGKLGVSNSILDKPGKLDPAEWAAIQQHPLHTYEILSRIAPFRRWARLAGAHHERLDGRGYPWGLAGESIPLETRIITVADVFDAISADRPYRAAMPSEKVWQIIGEMRGEALDPDCVDALRRGLAAEDRERKLDVS